MKWELCLQASIQWWVQGNFGQYSWVQASCLLYMSCSCLHESLEQWWDGLQRNMYNLHSTIILTKNKINGKTDKQRDTQRDTYLLIHNTCIVTNHWEQHFQLSATWPVTKIWSSRTSFCRQIAKSSPTWRMCKNRFLFLTKKVRQMILARAEKFKFHTVLAKKLPSDGEQQGWEGWTSCGRQKWSVGPVLD